MPLKSIPKDVTHSHADDNLAVHAEHVTCAHCGTQTAFTVPDGHNGSAVRWHCPNPECDRVNSTDGWDPAERAASMAQVVVPCAECATMLPFAGGPMDCPVCGQVNEVVVRSAADRGQAADKSHR